MRSMTDFINSASVDSQMAVYNEEYTWAEEYAEYYNESSNMYVGNILESSGYQFFGEACFIQEAKGLIVGGILALVSGAFFMIMKLLRNGGGSTSGGKSSTKSSKSENKSSATSSNSGGKGNKPKAQNTTPTPTPTLTPTSPTAVQPQTSNQNANSKQSEIKYADLDAEEKLTYSFATIFKKLDEYRKEGYEKVSINGGIRELDRILSGLGLIHDIARIMVDLVEKGDWYLFGSTDQKNPEVKAFTKKCDELDELVKTIKTSASTYQKRDNMLDEDLDSVKTVLKDIEKASKAIEKTCKKGIDKCKKTRETLKNEKKDVSNVDKSYKHLNGIIRNVNIVCKAIQNAFADIQNVADSKKLPFPLNVEYFILPKIGSPNDPFDEMDMIINKDPNSKMLMPSHIYATCIKGIREACNKALNVSAYSSISNRQIKLIEEDKYGHFKNSKAALQRSRGDFTKAFALMKKKWPDRVEELEYIEPFIAKGYDCLADLLNVPPKQMVGETQSDTKIPAIINLIKFRNEYLVDTKVAEISDKIADINYKNHTPFKNKKSNDKGSSVDAYVDNMPAISFKSFYEALKREAGGVYGVIGAQDRYNATWFNKKIQEVFKAYEKDPNETKFVNDAHSVINGYLYEADSRLSDHVWKRVENILDRIGYKSINAKVGDDINLSKRYWKIPIPAKNPGDKTPNTIKHISQMPRVMKINVDGDTVILKLGGKCTYWG